MDVSVIIPTYNNRNTITQAVNSALFQEGVEHEVIVIDDASTDGTHEVLAGHLKRDHFQLLTHRENHGGNVARNSGAAAARGRWLAFLDADDEWLQGRLNSTLDEFFERGVNWGIGAFDWSRPERHGQCVVPKLPPTASLCSILAEPPLGAGSTLMVDRNLFRDVGAFDESLPAYQDWDLVVRLSEGARGAVVQHPMVVKHRTGRHSYDSVRRARDLFLRKHAHLLHTLPAPEQRTVLAMHELALARFAYYSQLWPKVASHLIKTTGLSPRVAASWVRSRAIG